MDQIVLEHIPGMISNKIPNGFVVLLETDKDGVFRLIEDLLRELQMCKDEKITIEISGIKK